MCELLSVNIEKITLGWSVLPLNVQKLATDQLGRWLKIRKKEKKGNADQLTWPY